MKVLDISKSFTKAVLAVSLAIDFYLIILWLLGIDRTIAILKLRRINIQIPVTALSLFIPMKTIFTIWLWLKTKEHSPQPI